jgi:hypothetical protein
MILIAEIRVLRLCLVVNKVMACGDWFGGGGKPNLKAGNE